MSNLSVFSFKSNRVASDVRVIESDGKPWFVASDVAKILGYAQTNSMNKLIDDEDKSKHALHSGGNYVNQSLINESGLYQAIFGSTKPEAKAFKRWVTSEVLPAIRQAGGYSQVSINRTQADEKIDLLYMAERLADTLNLSGSGRIAAVGKLVERHIPELSVMLPHYAIDSPAGATEGSSEPTFSATHLLKQHGVDMTAAKFNSLCSEYGILHRKERESKSGGTKKFWSVSSAGLAYGKNITSVACQNETQPHWYESRFNDLLGVLLGKQRGKAAG